MHNENEIEKERFDDVFVIVFVLVRNLPRALSHELSGERVKPGPYLEGGRGPRLPPGQKSQTNLFAHFFI
jgi:hypothetical protein